MSKTRDLWHLAKGQSHPGQVLTLINLDNSCCVAVVRKTLTRVEDF
jgi:hypothetical protein